MSLEALSWYGSIFLWMFVTGIGIPPVPEEINIVGAAVATATHSELHWWIMWPVTIVSIVAADVVLYWVGRFWGRRLFKYRWFNRLVPPHRREKIEDGFHRHGVKILLTTRLVPPLRTAGFVTAGAIHYPFLRFLLADAIYAIPCVGLIFAFGWFAADTVIQLIAGIHKVQYWLLAAAILIGGGYGLYRYRRFLKERAATDSIEPPTLPDIMHPHPKPHPPTEGNNPTSS